MSRSSTKRCVPIPDSRFLLPDSTSLADTGFMLTDVVSKLSKYPALNNLEKQTSIPKAYAVLGLGALYFFLIIFNLGGQLLTNIAGFVIPGYYSLAALFSANKADDTQWLTVSGHTDPFVGCAAFADPSIVLGRLCFLHVGPICDLTNILRQTLTA
jgi:hypothetical protein